MSAELLTTEQQKILASFANQYDKFTELMEKITDTVIELREDNKKLKIIVAKLGMESVAKEYNMTEAQLDEIVSTAQAAGMSPEEAANMLKDTLAKKNMN